jgi:serine/threonine protein phosphatase 1
MRRLYGFRAAWEPAPRPTPLGTTLLAIGDVHGCSAQLDAMLGFLEPVIDAAQGSGRSCELVMLGDYADRGPDSLGVLGRLPALGTGLRGARVHLLRGNHDQMLLECLREVPLPGMFELWLQNGGNRVLAEAGIGPGHATPHGLSALLRERLGPEVTSLLRRLGVCRLLGGYLFVHGGVHPEVPLEEHSVDDLVWMREPFLSTTRWRHPFTVVHGHTPLGPEIFPHRIGLDSGCFFTGVLTAVEIADNRLRFHAVASGPELGHALSPGQPHAFGKPELLQHG